MKVNAANLNGRLPSATRASWLEYLAPIPPFKLVLESDTGIVRMGDGVRRYPELPPFIDQPLSPEAIRLLQTAGRNEPNGLILLDVNGNYPLQLLKPQLLPENLYVRNIAERDLIPVEQMVNSLVVVMDASADPQVGTADMAMYGYWDGDWILLSKIALPSQDDLTNFLNEEADTLDDVADGEAYIRMLFTERSKLKNIEAGATRTTTSTVTMAGAVMTGDKLDIGANHCSSLL